MTRMPLDHTYVSGDSHWWEGPQIYGSDAAAVEARNGEDGMVKLDEHGLIPTTWSRVQI